MAKDARFDAVRSINKLQVVTGPANSRSDLASYRLPRNIRADKTSMTAKRKSNIIKLPTKPTAKPTVKTAKAAKPATAAKPTKTAEKPKRKSAAESLRTLKELTKTAKAAKLASDKAKRERCDELLALIARKKLAVVDAFYDIGEALREILRKGLYQALKFSSFDAMLTKRKVFAATQAYKLIKIVENVPRDVALKLGQEKAYAMVSYTKATPEKDTVAGLVKKNAKVGQGNAKSASVRDIDRATAKVRGAKPKSKTEREKSQEHHALAQRFSALLAKHELGDVVVQEHGDRVLVALSYAQLAKLPAVGSKTSVKKRK